MPGYKTLLAYQKAKQVADEIFTVSKTFPPEEKYSLTDQIRRSSRSVCANFAEAYRKRKYVAHFVSKLTDADGELHETSHWISTALACKYIADDEHVRFQMQIEEIGKMLGKMMSMPEKFNPQQRLDGGSQMSEA